MSAVVTQADREAVNRQIGAMLAGDGQARLLAGKMDSLSLVQAFAAHREAHTAGLVEALQGLEQACEQLAATRTREAYLAMIDGGQGEALLALDARRQAARAALAEHAK